MPKEPSENPLRRVFVQARSKSPCISFQWNPENLFSSRLELAKEATPIALSGPGGVDIGNSHHPVSHVDDQFKRLILKNKALRPLMYTQGTTILVVRISEKGLFMAKATPKTWQEDESLALAGLCHSEAPNSAIRILIIGAEGCLKS